MKIKRGNLLSDILPKFSINGKKEKQVFQGFSINGKKGWLRILEATIAILVITGVLVLMYTRTTQESDDLTDYMYGLQREILNEISLDEELRSYVISTDDVGEDNPEGILKDFVDSKVPPSFSYVIKVCKIDKIGGGVKEVVSCNMGGENVRESYQKNIYASDIIIGSNIVSYGGAKRVKIFIWQQPR